MKKTVVFFTLLISCVAMFAQSGLTFPYQAVVRNAQNQLIKDSTFSIGVEIYQGADLKLSETQRVTTNANGQFTMNIGGGTVVSGALGDITDWSVAKFRITYHLSEGDIVSENAVSPVPYALQAANATSGNFLTSDSAVITTMQSDIATNRTDISTNATNIQTNTDNIGNLTLHTAKNALRDSVAGQIHDSIANIAEASHTHSNKALLDTYNQTNANLADAVTKSHAHANADILNNTTATYTDADSTKLDGIAEGAEVNVQSDWEQTDGNQDDYIKNKPTIPTVPTNVSAFTNDAGYLTSNNEIITNLSQLLQQLTARLDAQNAKIDSLVHLVDSLSNLTPGGGDTPTEVADGQPCPGAPTVSDVDGNTYNTVKIGNQCWMKENLRTNVDGSVYPKKNSSTELTADEQVTYGRLYTWTAMMNGNTSSNNVPSGVQGICPAGWHVPSDAEWDTLTKYVYNSANPDYKCSGCSSSGWEQSTKCIAKALSSTTGWNSSSSDGCYAGNTGAKANATGFAAVPAGYCFLGSSSYFGDEAYFWSATQSGDYLAWCRFLSGNDSYVTRYDANKDSGYSVRCLRDAGIGGGTNPSTPGEVSCEQVMECMADTLGALNARIESQGTEIETLNSTVTAQGTTITTQGETIDNLNNTVTTQGQTIDSLNNVVDSLSHVVDSLSGGGDTPTEVADGQPCPGAPTVSDVDGNTYNTVKIGNQCWMKENLRTNVGGSVYPIRGNETVTGEDTITYGRLYTWDAMMNNTASTNYPVSGSKVQGICPTGWHVPSDAEWDTLTHYVFSKDEYKCGSSCGEWQAQRDVSCIAKALSSTTGWSSNIGSGCNAGNTGDKANATGFSAVPAGFYHGFFSLFGKLAYFWSATQFDNSIACCRRLDGDASNVGWYYAEKYYGFSVRCLRDADNGGGDTPTEVADGQPCPGAATVSDGTNTYNTVKIGNQCWMKENLRTNVGNGVYPKKNNGQVELSEDEKVTYGRLYTWNAMMKGAPSTNYPAGTTEADTIVHGICPAGWHVPSNAEWTALTDYVKSKAEYQCDGSADNIAKALSSTTGWSSNTSEGCNAGNRGDKSNATGFSAVPAGYCFRGNFFDFGDATSFWSATQNGGDCAWRRYLRSDVSYVDSSRDYMDNGLSVRCLRDAGVGGGDTPDTPGSGDTPTGSFTCGTDKVKDVDNNEYTTVQIGNQCWMAQNLRTKTHQYGNVWTKTDVDSAIYGRYYDWAAVMQGESGNTVQGICPTGWHVPSDVEWTQLTDYVNTAANGYRCNGDGTIANALSSSTGWQSPRDCGAGHNSTTLNATGFSAVPAGPCFTGDFLTFGFDAYFWSATECDDYVAMCRNLSCDSSRVRSACDNKDNGFSVRCLRD